VVPAIFFYREDTVDARKDKPNMVSMERWRRLIALNPTVSWMQKAFPKVNMPFPTDLRKNNE